MNYVWTTAWDWYNQINWFERGLLAVMIIGAVFGIIEGLCSGVLNLYNAVLDWFGPKWIPQDDWASPHRFNKGIFLTSDGKQRRFDIQDYLVNSAAEDERRYLVREHSGGHYAVLMLERKWDRGANGFCDEGSLFWLMETFKAKGQETVTSIATPRVRED
jgi:hypothetical protein